jgi:HEAT repeat protein
MRAAAVEALRHFPDAPARQAVRDAAKDPDPLVRRAAGATR